jgi:hypothetical protein
MWTDDEDDVGEGGSLLKIYHQNSKDFYVGISIVLGLIGGWIV